MEPKLRLTLLAAGLSSGAAASLAQGPDGAAVAERVLALKQSLQESQQRLRAYEWIETTVVNLKGGGGIAHAEPLLLWR